MKYLFYSYYIELFLKGKLKTVQISLSGIITLLVVWADAGGSINYILGKSDSVANLLFIALLIYSLMNLAYSVFSSFDAPLSKVPGIKEKVKSDSSVVSENEAGMAKSKDGSKLILQNKSYGSGIKSSPKIEETKTGEIIKNLKTSESRKTTKEGIPAPPLEINIESTEEYLENTEEPNEKYSGIINDYTTDIIDFFETPPPGTKSAF